MLKLIGFEIQRKWKPAIISTAIYLVAMFLTVFYIQSKDLVAQSNGAAIILPLLLGSAFWFYVLIDGINNLRLEAKRSSRDLYFSLPFSGYAKIGSKLLISTLLTLMSGAIIVLTSLVSIGNLINENILREVLKLVSQEMSNTIYISLFFIANVTFFFAMFYLAFGIYRAFFSQFKHGGIITVAIYLFVNYIYSKIVSWIPISTTQNVMMDINLWQTLSLQLVLVTVSALITFALSGYLFDQRVNFD